MCAFDYPNVDNTNCDFISFENHICYLGSLAGEKNLLADTMSTTLYLKTSKGMLILVASSTQLSVVHFRCVNCKWVSTQQIPNHNHIHKSKGSNGVLQVQCPFLHRRHVCISMLHSQSIHASMSLFLCSRWGWMHFGKLQSQWWVPDLAKPCHAPYSILQWEYVKITIHQQNNS